MFWNNVCIFLPDLGVLNFAIDFVVGEGYLLTVYFDPLSWRECFLKKLFAICAVSS